MATRYFKQRLRQVISIEAVVTIHYFEFTKDFHYEGESHPFWELVYIDKGEIEVTAGQQILLLKKDEMIFHKPDEYHNIVCNGVIAPNVFITSFDTSSPQMRFFENRILQISPEQKLALSELMVEGMQAFKGPFDVPFKSKMYKNRKAPLGAEQRYKNLLELFLIDLIRQNLCTAKSERVLKSSAQSVAHGTMPEVARFLEDNLQESVTIAQLSEIFQMSESTLKQTFRDYTGKPVIQYHNELKIKEAKRLIREEKHTITAISQLLGFSSVHYFSRCFKKHTSMSPTTYRSSLKAKLDSYAR
ncbi:MAG: AraC family transcriptional regulator [Limnochordia bacterium]|nr:AraC family transcriptional regulator [Limnochordia bacterium]